MKRAFTLLALFIGFTANAQYTCKHTTNGTLPALTSVNDTRSDSINITKTTINLTVTDFANKRISGNTKIDFAALVNGIGILPLDLLSMTIDSVTVNGGSAIYTYDGERLNIFLPSILNTGNAATATVYYNGAPVTDGGGFGGFYFSGPYAYAISVGFLSIPHNFGRSWFATFDNFKERFIVEQNITVSTTNSVAGNGTQQSITDNGNGTRTFSWLINDEIPSYLTSIAVAPYVVLQDSYPSIGGGNIPVKLYCLATDSTELKNSFANLHSSFDHFENLFGKYEFERVGFVLVPFNGGAMEHATNIAYATFLVNNTLQYENIMAHELSHMWFGDLVTCERAEEMWLNEGFATYCEKLFYEDIYGYPRYLTDVRANHKDVLHFAHVKDTSYWAIANVPQNVTYGTHSYGKGADVLHSLRTYMGDAAFFGGLKQYLANHHFTHVNSNTLKTELENFSGQNLTNFFNNWVFDKGYTHFSIDSFSVAPQGNQFAVTVHFRQRLRAAQNLYTNVPFNVFFKSNTWQQDVKPVTLSGATQTATFTVPFAPTFVALNLDDRISHGITHQSAVLQPQGTNISLSNAYFSINPTNNTDSSFIFVEHNFIAPDVALPQGSTITLSPQRYWKVSGLFAPNFEATGVIQYDGRTPSSSSGWLDNLLITGTEDSLILMHRPGAGSLWFEYPYYTKNMGGNNTNKQGSMQLSRVVPGEYCFAKGVSTLGVQETAQTPNLKLYPNPAKSFVNLQNSTNFKKGETVTITNLEGKVVKTILVKNPTAILTIDINGLPQGIYTVTLGSSTVSLVVN